MTPDAELVARSLAGDESALQILVSRHLKPVYNFVHRFCPDPDETEDVTQEVFLKAWRSLHRFNPAKSFKTWLLAIARNAALDQLRRRRSIPFSVLAQEEADFADTLTDQSPSADELFANSEQTAALERALATLSPEIRSIVLLRHLEDLTFEEIAEVTGEPMNTVKSRYRRALTKLRSQL